MLRRYPRLLTYLARNCSTNSRFKPNDEIVPMFMNNRNPRNLEKLRIAYKPIGWAMDLPGKSYWNKLVIKANSKYVLAYVNHYVNGNVIEASTNEWAIKKQLYSTTDSSAYINLGRVLAQRCLMMGVTEIFCDLNCENSSKIKLFMEEMTKGGVSLVEPPVFKTPEPMDAERPEKPWEVTEP